MLLLWCWAVFSSITFAFSEELPQRSSPLNPVILFHGAGGAQLEVKLDRAMPCLGVSANYSLLWINLGYLNPFVFDCFKDMMKLAKNPEGEFGPQNDIHIRAKGFGTTSSIEVLEPIVHAGPGLYMKTLVDHLVKLGYKRDATIRAAQYDFRLGISKLEAAFQ